MNQRANSRNAASKEVVGKAIGLAYPMGKANKDTPETSHTSIQISDDQETENILKFGLLNCFDQAGLERPVTPVEVEPDKEKPKSVSKPKPKPKKCEKKKPAPTIKRKSRSKSGSNLSAKKVRQEPANIVSRPMTRSRNRSALAMAVDPEPDLNSTTLSLTLSDSDLDNPLCSDKVPDIMSIAKIFDEQWFFDSKLAYLATFKKIQNLENLAKFTKLYPIQAVHRHSQDTESINYPHAQIAQPRRKRFSSMSDQIGSLKKFGNLTTNLYPDLWQPYNKPNIACRKRKISLDSGLSASPGLEMQELKMSGQNNQVDSCNGQQIGSLLEILAKRRKLEDIEEVKLNMNLESSLYDSDSSDGEIVEEFDQNGESIPLIPLIPDEGYTFPTAAKIRPNSNSKSFVENETEVGSDTADYLTILKDYEPTNLFNLKNISLKEFHKQLREYALFGSPKERVGAKQKNIPG